MANILAERRAASADRLRAFQEKLSKATEICEGKACVYVTGSFGRGDASEYSDLDLFIVGRTRVDASGEEVRELSNLEKIRLKAELIDVSRDLDFEDFSGDGEYLEHYTINDLVKTTGKPEDDANNTFTARLLLLLESRPLVGNDVYREAIDAAIQQYWRDYKSHEKEFVPAFLANDILRLWRTFCVNYEARTSDIPEEKKNKRRLKNYKLKYSRMLTCYSALIYLLALHNRTRTAKPEDIREMVAESPTRRLESLLDYGDLSAAHSVIQELLQMYGHFLSNTNANEATLLQRFSDKATRTLYSDQARAFGDTVFTLIGIIGQERPLHRLLVV